MRLLYGSLKKEREGMMESMAANALELMVFSTRVRSSALRRSTP
jgi:hypothetical protein